MSLNHQKFLSLERPVIRGDRSGRDDLPSSCRRRQSRTRGIGKKSKVFFGRSLFLFLLLFAALSGVLAQSRDKPTSPDYNFVIESGWLTMRDGVRLSATSFKPVPLEKDEKFPVLLELLPYRKDDSGYMGNYSLYTYFVRRGYIMVRVDIRGTGSSEGAVLPREYSEQELQDAVEIIGLLSRMPGSNGSVGMWGISWGGFNAIQVAMRQPPALKAILAAHATDDLYHDDIHYIDGACHIDEWAFWFDHANAIPRSPEYPLDEDYFRDRFNAYPGIMTYLKQQKDGDFWRKNSLRWQYDKIKIPVYLIGGLLDGYRDSVPRLLENMKVPVRAAVGPWNHAWPDNGEPGPNYEWRYEAVRWWDQWLKGRNTGVLDDPPLTVFVREGHGPDVNLKMTPGRWICENWPIPGTAWKKFYPSPFRKLKTEIGEPAAEKLCYGPGFGVATGLWWGEVTGDMRHDDAGSLVYDSPVVEESFEIVGMPRVRLRVFADAPQAHWVARLEDVQPDGTVSLVTGALINGSQRNSRLHPEALVPGEIYDIEFDMHFTTWTFQPGHRIRLSVSNSLFPMIWPTPHKMTTQLFLGSDKTCLELPVIPNKKRPLPSFLTPEPREQRTDARYLGGGDWPAGEYEWERDLWGQKTSVRWKGFNEYEIRGRRYYSWEKNFYQTTDEKPDESCFLGKDGDRIELEDRTLELKTSLEILSDEKNFHVTFAREIFENGKLVRRREWKESIPRDFN